MSETRASLNPFFVEQRNVIFKITTQGPQEKLGIALTKVYEKANSVSTAEVNAPSWIHRHVIGKRGSGIRSITQDFPKVMLRFLHVL